MSDHGLQLILESFADLRDMGTVAFYTVMAEKLSAAINRPTPWTWRYVQGVEMGTIQPSKDFSRAVTALGMALDGAPLEMTGTEEVRVFAFPGKVLPGSLILGSTRICARPGCGARFVPNVPWRKYCGRCNR